MNYIQAFWLAVIQGLTEFLPVSSSGHLALVPWLLGWADQGLEFDVAVHVGTLAAVITYFHRDIRIIVLDWVRSIISGVTTVHSKLAWSIIFASALVGVAGVFLETLVSSVLRNPVCIALASIVFGIVLWLTDRFGKRQRDLSEITWKDVLVIGLAQILALIPGTSRSGITISAGLMLGLTRQAAARYSFLLAIPVIAMAGVWQLSGIEANPLSLQWKYLIFGSVISAIIAMLSIHYFLRYIERFSLVPFAIYRIILGVILLYVFL